MSRTASVARALLYTLVFPILFSACATSGSIEEYKDPFEKYNRAVYKFNDGFDRAILKPVAKGYRKVVPGGVRKSVGNFFRNLLFYFFYVNIKCRRFYIC